jgi:phage tail-like protein
VSGVRVAHGAPVRYQPEGSVMTVALDSGVFRQRWGRVFVDACVPPGTGVSVAFLTGDDLPGDELDGLPVPLGEQLTVDHTAPSCLTDDEVTPTVPSDLPLPAPDAPDRFGADRPLYRRESVEQPWLQPRTDDPFVTYEAPVNAGPGRYLWLRLRLRATGLRTPRVRAVRAESVGPKLLERLPRVYTEDATATGFLDRYLTMANEPMADLGAAADARHVLLDPTSAPAQLLPWLASLVGLTLDPRWPEPARRAMIAQAVPLFRRRGTLGALLTMLEIVLGVRPVLVERYRFRGLTGTVGTSLVRTGSTFEEYAHRFSLVIPGALSADLLAAVTDLVTEHRPAHTLFEICSARTGSRIGIGLHLGLTSVVGNSSGWTELAVGGVLGRDGVLGRPTAALRVGAGAVGLGARVEP